MVDVRRVNAKAEAEAAKAKAAAKAAAGAAKAKQKPPPKQTPLEAASAKLRTIREGPDLSIQSGGASLTADDASSSAWIGGVGAAEPEESHAAPSKPPPDWAMPKFVKMPKCRPVSPTRGTPGMVPVSLQEDPRDAGGIRPPNAMCSNTR